VKKRIENRSTFIKVMNKYPVSSFVWPMDGDRTNKEISKETYGEKMQKCILLNLQTLLICSNKVTICTNC